MRQLNLRQIEAFKAIIECGTVSAAAEMMGISQSAASKLLAHLEDDVGFALFERNKGRLVTNVRGMRFYDEVQRIFAGIRQVERAAEMIRREEQGRISIGVMPGLSGRFIQRVTDAFLVDHPGTFVSIKDGASRQIAEWTATRQVDLGIISTRFDNQNLITKPLLEHPLTCILPTGHPLASKREIRHTDLHDEPFISFSPESQTRQLVDATLAGHDLRLNVILEASAAPTVCESVAAGLGIAIIYPLHAHGVEKRVVMRPFTPAITYEAVLATSREGRNGKVVDAFIAQAQAVAATTTREMLARL